MGNVPLRGELLTMDDIVPIKTGKIMKPRPVQAASIPGMLGMFQIEWDGLMLSNFALEQQLHIARQELSHALYQHDAACCVIARLRKERDEARALLAQAKRQIPLPLAAPYAVNAAALSNGKRAAEDNEIGPDGKKWVQESQVALFLSLQTVMLLFRNKGKRDRFLQHWLPLNLWRNALSSIVILFIVLTNLAYYHWISSIPRT